MNTFAALDFETANQYRSSVCSIGLVFNRNNETKDLPLVAHNSMFDEGCLRAVLAYYALPQHTNPFFCTLRAARKSLPQLVNYKLDTVSAYFGFDLKQHHHALADAEACAHIALELFK